MPVHLVPGSCSVPPSVADLGDLTHCRIDLELDTSSSVFEGSEGGSQPVAATDRERSVTRLTRTDR